MHFIENVDYSAIWCLL